MLVWIPRLRTRRVASLRYLHDANEFRVRLREEQKRTNRSGLSFTLATFWIQDQHDVREKLEVLQAACESRLRETDYAGVWDSAKVGVILPYTNAAGAWTLVDDLQQQVAEHIDHLQCEVFEYPSHPAVLANEGDFLQAAVVEDRLDRELKFAQVVDRLSKKVIDYVVASVALLALAPLVAISALAIKLTSPGPVFFCQQREGLNGRLFYILKLRTMHDGAEQLQEQLQEQLRELSEQDGPAFKLTNDPRITTVGRFLRITSIDELPQLWNVLRGEMSLVGPRPLPVSESRSCQPWQRRRLSVQPGITCIWQVYARSRVSFDEWIRMDLRYVDSRSWAQDLKLLALTIPAVLSRRGAK